MINQPVILLVLACVFTRIVQSNVVLNLTNTEKLLCYSCKGSNCESITNDEDNIVLCNKFTQLCWVRLLDQSHSEDDTFSLIFVQAGFIDQQPYRACASRYCTPSGISLDSDVRIESCCHSNLCNTVSRKAKRLTRICRCLWCVDISSVQFLGHWIADGIVKAPRLGRVAPHLDPHQWRLNRPPLRRWSPVHNDRRLTSSMRLSMTAKIYSIVAKRKNHHACRDYNWMLVTPLVSVSIGNVCHSIRTLVFRSRR